MIIATRNPGNSIVSIHISNYDVHQLRMACWYVRRADPPPEMRTTLDQLLLALTPSRIEEVEPVEVAR